MGRSWCKQERTDECTCACGRTCVCLAEGVERFLFIALARLRHGDFLHCKSPCRSSHARYSVPVEKTVLQVCCIVCCVCMLCLVFKSVGLWICTKRSHTGYAGRCLGKPHFGMYSIRGGTCQPANVSRCECRGMRELG